MTERFTRLTTRVAALLLVACSCGGARTSTTGTEQSAVDEAPSRFHVELDAPGTPARFVSATLDDEPFAVTGCVMPAHAPCEESMRVVLDDDARQELQALLDDLAATPRCEPDGLHEGDRDYTLAVEGGATYAGHVPADPAHMAARNGGPCRADARLAWWIARWLVGEIRSAAENPSRVSVTVDASDASGARLVNATIELASTPTVIEGCISSARGACAATRRVELAPAARSRLGVLLEDVRSEPCHVPFPAGDVLAIEAGLVYDGPCGADADLAWWTATMLDPTSLGAR